VFSYVLAGFIMFVSSVLLLYFSFRAVLLLRGSDANINARLDRDLKNGLRIWIAIRSLMPPMCMAV